MDIYSCKVVGWEIHDTESSDHSSMLVRKTYLREGVAGKPLVLNSDNGSPMKGATVLMTLKKLNFTFSSAAGKPAMTACKTVAC